MNNSVPDSDQINFKQPMISVIISKYHPSLVEKLSENIRNTIGVPFEIIVIENGKGKMGLCEVYNTGAQKAVFDILCFSHEDVEMQTMDWGKNVCQIFDQQKNLGLLGVAGSRYKPLSPSGWWYENAHPAVMVSNYIQSDKSGEKAALLRTNPSNEKLSDVVCVDGFWFCTPRAVALSIKFDEHLFKGFHCYDIDYSISVFQHYRVCICFDILIRHNSEGSQNREWVNETLKLSDKWKNVLPLHSVSIDGLLGRQEEMFAFYYFLKEMQFLAFPLSRRIALLSSPSTLRQVGIRGVARLLSKMMRDVYSAFRFSFSSRFRAASGR